MEPRTRRIVLAGLAIAATALLAWQFRWHIGGQAIRIADPIIRRWAISEVSRLSDGAYVLALSPIQVDITERRVAIDTVTVTTDQAANGKRNSPLPALSLRFHRCLASGIDVDRLTAGRGLAIANVGCDTVAIGADVPAGVARDTSGGGFLTLRQDLDLARNIPYIRIDTISFPQVRLGLGIAGRGNRRTMINFERLGVRLDSLHYDPEQPAAERRTFLSRNVSVALDAFAGARENSDRLEIRSIRADLAAGTFEMLGFDWAPLPGPFADSLGLRDLAVDSLSLSGVDWGGFLTSGDVNVRRIALSGAAVGLLGPGVGDRQDTADADSPVELATLPWTLERTLRSLERTVVLDTVSGRNLKIGQTDARDTIRVTRVDSLDLTGLAFGPEPERWQSDTPLGAVHVAATGVSHRWGDRTSSLAGLDFDASAGRLAVRRFAMAPVGTDRDFVRRQRYRKDRIAVSADSVELAGLDVASFIRAGAYHARSARISGLDLDVMSDKGLPSRPVRSRHRTPQTWLQSATFDVRLDTLVATGRLQYRERMAEAARPGVLRFERATITARNFTTRPRPGTADTIIRVGLQARLMGSGDLRTDFLLPATRTRFDMSYRGRLGTMPVTALNEFLEGATVARFEKGDVTSIDFDVRIVNGTASGVVRPIYRDLDLKLPGVARSGILGGIRRAIAQVAAEQFFLRTTNAPGESDTVKTGAVSHRRASSETLIQTVWFALRSGLIDGVKP